MPTMSRSARGVIALTNAMLRVEELEGQLKAAQVEVRRLEEVELPAAFTEDGVSEIGIPGCPKAAKDVTVQGSFPSPYADRPDALERYETAKAWMVANGHEDSLRAVVAANYGAGEREAALEAYGRLRGDNRASVSITETVHHSTLRAIVRQRVAKAQPTPVEDLGCVVIRKVKLASKPVRRVQIETESSIQEQS